MPQSTEDFRLAFNVKLKSIVEKKGRTACFLSKGRYEWIIGRLNELSSDNTSKKTSQDHRIMARYDICERNNNNIVKKSR